MSAFATMLPRLSAEEQLAAVRGAALVAGQYAEHDARALMAGLERQAAGEPSTGSAQAEGRARKAGPGELAMIGIGAVVVPPDPPGTKPVEGFHYV